MFLESNLECLRHRNPDLAERIVALTEVSPFQFIPAKRHGLALIWNKNDTETVKLTSVYDPIDEAIKIVESQWDPDTQLAVVYGMVGIEHILIILDRLSENDDLIVVEPNLSLLKIVFDKVDLTDIIQDTRFHIVSQPEVGDSAYFVSVFIHRDAFRIPRLTFVEYPAYLRANSDYFTSCTELIRDSYQLAFSNISTRLTFGNQWVSNVLANFSEIVAQHDLDELKGSLNGKPVILISAGPSLNRNIDLLHQCKGRAFLLCVDTALSALLKRGIKPDAVVAVDGSLANAKHFDGIEYSDIPLFAAISCHKDIVGKHKGTKYFFCSYDDILPWCEEVLGDKLPKANLTGGGSVATMAFTIAMYLGANELIFVGQDLSYPGGQAYATGTRNDQRTLQDLDSSRQRIKVIDIDGNDVYTTFDYFMYLKWFHGRLKTLVMDETKTFINATEGGALREHLQILTLQQVLETRLQRKYNFDSFFPVCNDQSYTLQQFLDSVPNLEKTFEEIKEISVIAKECKERLQNFNDQEEIDALQFSQEVKEINLVQDKIIGFELGLKYLDAVGYIQIFTDIYSDSIEREKAGDDMTQSLRMQIEHSLSFFTRLEVITEQGLEILEDNFGLR